MEDIYISLFLETAFKDEKKQPVSLSPLPVLGRVLKAIVNVGVREAECWHGGHPLRGAGPSGSEMSNERLLVA